MPAMREFTETLKDRFTERELQRLLFYGDILVVGIFVIALAFLVRDTYIAGVHLGNGELGLHGDYLWAMVRDGALLLGSLGWILTRFFRDQLRELRNPWM